MKIMIGGGYNDAKSDTNEGKTFALFVRKLAEEIIRQGHELRCGNLSSLDALAIEAACDEAKNMRKDEEQVVVSYVPKGQSARARRGSVNQSSNDNWNSMSGRKPNIPEPIDQADVLILVGGFGADSGTYTAANWARQTRTHILPIATFDMASRDIFEDLPHGAEQRKVTGLGEADLRILTRALSVLDDDDKVSAYAKKIVSLAEKAALSRDVFVIMSFSEDDDLRDYRAAVEDVCRKAGFEAVRTDTRPASDSHQIIDAVHDNITNCGFVIADLTNERPNVYYEIGFARGIDKKLIITSKKNAPVHFDLQGFNRIQWRGSENLKEQLKPVVAKYAALFGLSSRS